MRVVERRRRGWNNDAPPVPRLTGAKIHQRAVRMSPFTRKLGAGLLITLLVMVIFAACFVAFHVIGSKQISFPAALTHVHRSAPLHPSAPASAITPLPPLHNSPDTECDQHRQCTDEEFAGLTESLGRQWALLLKSFGPGVPAIRRIRHWNTVFSRKVCPGWTSIQRKQLPGLILRISTRPSWPFARRIPNLFLFA